MVTRWGSTSRHDPKKPITIVGVVGVAVKQYGLDTDGKIAVYFPSQQDFGRGTYLVARSATENPALAKCDDQRDSCGGSDGGGLWGSKHAGPLV